MKTRSILALVGLAISFTLRTFGQQQKSLKELIVGTWLLESVYDQTQDGEKHNPWGDGVKGQAIYTSDGHFSWIFVDESQIPTLYFEKPYYLEPDKGVPAKPMPYCAKRSPNLGRSASRNSCYAIAKACAC